ncbi:MAG TPA: hypothetical protein VM621_17120 [Luteibacter sp.]|uniref:hypothetical protein n=1 Tax=Luteibacter sp. TaxID=1886636 RepID=UPI002C2E1EE6|nr:hypothetical protein [Luteibacter sp.]HVI56765.1 hypothetical protein [Luteibacter sp.]
MYVTRKSIAMLAGLVLALAGGRLQGPGQPSFDAVAAVHRSDFWSTDPCGPHRPMAAVCRMLRPVRG